MIDIYASVHVFKGQALAARTLLDYSPEGTLLSRAAVRDEDEA